MKKNSHKKDNVQIKIDSKGLFIIMILVAVIVLSIPLLIRAVKYDNYLPGETSYFNARIAENTNNVDDFIIGGNDVKREPYQYSLYGISRMTGMKAASYIIPILMGILSLLVFYDILKKKIVYK